MYQHTVKKSEEWKKGDNWKQQSQTLNDIDEGSVMRNHPHLMRPAGPDEEEDLRVGLLLYGDEVETVDTGYAKSKHKLLAVQTTMANLPVDMRFDHDVIQLLAIARHPAVMSAGQAGIFAGIDGAGKKIATGKTLSDDFIEGAQGRWFKVLNADGTEKRWRLKLHVVVVCGDYPQVRLTRTARITRPRLGLLPDPLQSPCVTRCVTSCVTPCVTPADSIGRRCRRCFRSWRQPAHTARAVVATTGLIARFRTRSRIRSYALAVRGDYVIARLCSR